jgi:hypothetical protein
MGQKSDKAETARRVEEVLRVRLDGAQFHDIVQYGSEQGWNVGARQIRKYIARADALLVERQDKSRKQVVARHLAQRSALYARAVNAADYRTALAVLADEAKLRGLYPDREVRELVKLVAAQTARIEELERRRDAHATSTGAPDADPERGPAGPASDGATGRAGGAGGSVPVEPGAADERRGDEPGPVAGGAVGVHGTASADAVLPTGG